MQIHRMQCFNTGGTQINFHLSSACCASEQERETTRGEERG